MPPFQPVLTEQQLQMLRMAGLRNDGQPQMSPNMPQPQMSPLPIPPQGVQDDLAPGQITDRGLALLQKAQNEPISGMDTIRNARAVGPGTALAQSLAALGSNYMGGKARKKQTGALRQTLQSRADAEAKTLAAETAEEQSRYETKTESDDKLQTAQIANYNSQVEDRQKIDPKKVEETIQTEEGLQVIFEDGSSKLIPGIQETIDPNDVTRGAVVEYFDEKGDSHFLSQVGDKLIDDTGTERIPSKLGWTKVRPAKTGKVPSSIVRKRREHRNVSRQANSLIERMKKLNEQGVSIKDNVPTEFARGAARAISPEAMTAYETSVRDPEVLSILDDMEFMSADLLHEKYGGAFTMGEGERGKRWDPSALGLNDLRTIQRLQNIANVADDNVADLMGDYTWDDTDFDISEKNELVPAEPGKDQDAADKRIDELLKENKSIDDIEKILMQEGYES